MNERRVKKGCLVKRTSASSPRGSLLKTSSLLSRPLSLTLCSSHHSSLVSPSFLSPCARPLHARGGSLSPPHGLYRRQESEPSNRATHTWKKDEKDEKDERDEKDEKDEKGEMRQIDRNRTHKGLDTQGIDT